MECIIFIPIFAAFNLNTSVMLIVASNKFWVLTVVCHFQKNGQVVVHEYEAAGDDSSVLLWDITVGNNDWILKCKEKAGKNVSFLLTFP